ncbi:MAG: tRNA pseudouridine(38-40) synthase TruA [Clostridia bacterium]
MRNIKLILEFDGTNYSGWMRQGSKSIPTVQSAMEIAVRKLTGETVEMIGCSRTDAGVHALHYAANFHTSCTIPAENLYQALNPVLPGDIKVKASEEVPPEFHAVYSAKSKTYRYYFYFDEIQHPLLQNRAWNAAKKTTLSTQEILQVTNRACRFLTGTHDFTAFKASGGLAKTTVRTIFSAEVKQDMDQIFYLEICGNGFLYNMVRIIAGTLAGVVRGRFRPEEIPEMIRSRERKKAGMTAPPHGLYLYRVSY